MKTLVLVRHAKSDWNDPFLSDFERTLNKRGIADAPLMAIRFTEKSINPDLIISSPAVRAITTCKYFADELNYDEDKIQLVQDIYDASAGGVLNIIGDTDDSVNTLMLFGHNPAISNLSSYLTSMNFGEVPTCAVVCIEFSFKHWKDIHKNTGILKFFDYPNKK